VVRLCALPNQSPKTTGGTNGQDHPRNGRKEHLGQGAAPWQVRIEKNEKHGTKGSVLGRWKTKKKAQDFADAFNKIHQ